MWIARDDDGQLFAYAERPVRDEDIFDGDDCVELNGDEFPEVTWENSPVEIKTPSNKGIGIDWEQRRYEIAKDVLAAYFSNPNDRIRYSTPETFAADAVELANVLIEELKK